jgi:hypothetical protein
MRLMSHKSYTQSYDNKIKKIKRKKKSREWSGERRISLFIGAHKLLIVQLTNTWDFPRTWDTQLAASS